MIHLVLLPLLLCCWKAGDNEIHPAEHLCVCFIFYHPVSTLYITSLGLENYA
jgi:hypothetical protein